MSNSIPKYGLSANSPNPISSKSLNFMYYIKGNVQLALSLLLTRLNRLAKSICHLLGVSKPSSPETADNMFERIRAIIRSFRTVQVCLRTRSNGSTLLECKERSADPDPGRPTAVMFPVINKSRSVDGAITHRTTVIEPESTSTVGNLDNFVTVMTEHRKVYPITKDQLERVRLNIYLGTMPVQEYLTMVYQEHRLPGFLYDHLDSKAKYQLKSLDIPMDSDKPPNIKSQEYLILSKNFLKALKDRKKFILSEVVAGRQNISPVYLYALLWAYKYVGELYDPTEIVNNTEIDNYINKLSNL